MSNSQIPVITLDGPSASGKGTIARRVSQALGFHYLDSGALYRLVALEAMQRGIDIEQEQQIADIASHLNVIFDDASILLNQKDVGAEIRTEACGEYASKIAALPVLRTTLLERQRAFREPPGLVTDGRDMGSVIFPDASVKIFLTATVEERAQRRYKQLMEKGVSASIDDLLLSLIERDKRDSQRATSPLIQCDDAHVLDTTGLSIDQVVGRVLTLFSTAVNT